VRIYAHRILQELGTHQRRSVRCGATRTGRSRAQWLRQVGPSAGCYAQLVASGELFVAMLAEGEREPPEDEAPMAA
jgi:hypothetical protein